MNMLNFKKFAYLITIILYTGNGYGWINIDAFDKSVAEMEKDFNNIRKDILKDFKNEFKNTQYPAWKISYESDKDNPDLKIIITEIDTHNIDSELNDDGSRLSISVDGGTLVIKTLKSWISLSIEQHIEHTEQTKRGTRSHSSVKAASSSQTLAHAIDLQSAHISYTAAEKKLTIVIPYKKSDLNNKKIPVKMQ